MSAHVPSPYRAQAQLPSERLERSACAHPCTHCASRPQEQAAFDAWATANFNGRASLVELTAHINTATAYMTRFAVSGDADLVLDQLAFAVALGYRVAAALESDLWEQVTVKIAELQSAPDHLERF